MKKFWITGLSLLLALSFTACAKIRRPRPHPHNNLRKDRRKKRQRRLSSAPGAPGMMTAIELKNNGQDVILLEKQAMPGGATLLAATYLSPSIRKCRRKPAWD